MVFLGLLAAIMLFIQEPVSQYLADEKEAIELDSASQENDSEENIPEESFNVLTYEVLVPVLNFNLFHSFDLLIELPSLENSESEIEQNSVLIFDTFFDKLFNRIIAPNAP